MPRPKVSAFDLVIQAIHEAGTTDPGRVSLQIEDIVSRKLSNRKQRYKTPSILYQEIGRYGIGKYSDVVNLVEQVRRAV